MSSFIIPLTYGVVFALLMLLWDFLAVRRQRARDVQNKAMQSQFEQGMKELFAGGDLPRSDVGWGNVKPGD